MDLAPFGPDEIREFLFWSLGEEKASGICAEVCSEPLFRIYRLPYIQSHASYDGFELLCLSGAEIQARELLGKQ